MKLSSFLPGLFLFKLLSKLETLVDETNLSRSTIIKFRNAILEYLKQNPQRIGGYNRDVQVNETLVFLIKKTCWASC